MTNDIQLTELQVAIMQILWEKGEARVAEVHEELNKKQALAHTTVATMLSRLEKRKILAHRVEGRQFVYRALVDEQQVRRSMVGDLTEGLFGGDVAEFVSHLLKEADVTAGDLARVRQLLEEKEKKEAERRDG